MNKKAKILTILNLIWIILGVFLIIRINITGYNLLSSLLFKLYLIILFPYIGIMIYVKRKMK